MTVEDAAAKRRYRKPPLVLLRCRIPPVGVVAHLHDGQPHQYRQEGKAERPDDEIQPLAAVDPEMPASPHAPTSLWVGDRLRVAAAGRLRARSRRPWFRAVRGEPIRTDRPDALAWLRRCVSSTLSS